MLIAIKKLLTLPVFTESGTKLGFIRDVELTVETHSVQAYLIGHKILGKEKYLISPYQVKAITAEKMIIEDGLMPVAESSSFQTKTSTPQMAMTIEEK